MKRYLIFIGSIHYPDGGMDDFKGDFDTLEDAVVFIEKTIDENKIYDSVEKEWEYNWAHIWDTDTCTKVWKK